MLELRRRARGLFVALHRDECAQDLIEYALLVAVVALGAVVSFDTVTNAINTAFSHVHKHFHSHIGKHLGWSK